MVDGDPSEFLRQAERQRGKSPSVIREFAAFLRAEKKWWLAPLLLVLLLFAGLIALSGSAAAPFIYSLF
ncbi:MAG: hypothetical protein RLZZ436_4409 [Planctomycetota bacterium]|jgi:hypothetical protein